MRTDQNPSSMMKRLIVRHCCRVREENTGKPYRTLIAFFERLYNYFDERGFVCIVVKRVLNLCTLAFTILFSAFLLIFVNWSELLHRCRVENECDNIAGVDWNALDELSGFEVLVIVYLALFSIYWFWTLYRALVDIRSFREVKGWYNNKLGVSDRDLQTMDWRDVEVLLVDHQAMNRIILVKEHITAHDIALRLMRKENYLIGFINKRVIPLYLPLPFFTTPLLTKTLEWNIYYCVLDFMFDSKFCIRKDFIDNPGALRRRFLVMGFVNLFLSPFLIIFMLVYFIMRNAEQFYHQPTSMGMRQWTPYAKWVFREFNELPLDFQKRLAQTYSPADDYLRQFPQHLVSMVARFIAFVIGSFAAVLAFIGLVNAEMLNNEIFDQKLWWYIAIFGTILAVSRTLIEPRTYVFQPKESLAEVAKFSHFMPKRWRGNEHSHEVRNEFAELYQYRVVIFLTELFGVIYAPLLLWFSLPQSADDIINFVKDFTKFVEGVGDVCGFASFDFEKYGSVKYGSSVSSEPGMRSRQGKMEKSFLSFKNNHPGWQHNESENFMSRIVGGTPGSGSSLLVPDSSLMANSGPAGAPSRVGASTQLLAATFAQQGSMTEAEQFFMLDKYYQTHMHDYSGDQV
eukprot:Rmarinus@m.3997